MIEDWNDEFSESYIQMLQKDIELARLKSRLEQAEREIEDLQRQLRGNESKSLT